MPVQYTLRQGAGIKTINGSISRKTQTGFNTAIHFGYKVFPESIKNTYKAEEIISPVITAPIIILQYKSKLVIHCEYIAVSIGIIHIPATSYIRIRIHEMQHPYNYKAYTAIIVAAAAILVPAGFKPKYKGRMPAI